MKKVVSQVTSRPAPHWVGDGFYVNQMFSHMGKVQGPDPFLMLDYARPYEYSPSQGKPRGVGQHPHKGFETITIAYQGEVQHRDSAGNGGTLLPGDVQWMTAGAGVIHEEFHSEKFTREGGTFEMVQLWLNLPRKFKLEPAHYQHLAAAEIPVVQLANQAGSLRLIGGEYQGVKGAANTYSPINLWDLTLQPKVTTSIEIPANHSLAILVLRGTVESNGHQAGEAELISYEISEGTQVELTNLTNYETKLLVLSGEPLNEPIAGYGPFVMNSKEEIVEAIEQYRNGNFGKID